jgi:hypothetical protein
MARYKLMADKMCRWYDYDSCDIPGLGKMRQGRREPLNHKPTRKKNKGGTKRRPPPDVRINLEGDQYYIFTKDKIYHASLDELGEIVNGDLYLGHAADLELDI